MADVTHKKLSEAALQAELEQHLVKKNQTSLTDEIDQKILFMFSMGMSYRDINKHIEDMYGMNVATGMNGRFKACISSPNEIGRRDCA